MSSTAWAQATDALAGGPPLQQSAPFSTVARELTVGDHIAVVDREGQTGRGTVISASASMLSVMIDGDLRDYAVADVQVVSIRTSRAKDDALIGLGVGATLGVAWCVRVNASADRCLAGSAIYGGIGAAIGAAIGASRSHERELYRAPPTGAPGQGPAVNQAGDRLNLAKPRPNLKWAASIVTATTTSGPATDLEDAMRVAQFDENRGSCIFGLCFPGVNHPFSTTGFGAIGFPWTIGGERWLSSWYGVGVSGGSAAMGETDGQRRDTGEYLSLRYTVSTVAPLFVVRPVHGVHAGIGPALFMTTVETGPSALGPVQSQTTKTAGLLWEAAATVPPRSRLFGEILAQYRQVGHVDIGPFVATNGFSTSTLPATRVQMSHWLLGVGVGVRF